MKTRYNFIVLVTLLALILSACGGGAPATSGEPAVLKIGWLGEPDTLNPAYAFLTEAYAIFDLVYSPLVTEDASGNYVGALAKEWSTSDDGLTWTFTLKDGVKWHNLADRSLPTKLHGRSTRSWRTPMAGRLFQVTWAVSAK
ncbi:MAG: ABC transporter substrate-binding protein [Anaerolineales bacterium]